MGGFHGLLVDGTVSDLNGGVYPRADPRRRQTILDAILREVGDEGFGGKMAGDFASCGASHSVADNKDFEERGGRTGVLILTPHLATVRQHREDGFSVCHKKEKFRPAENNTRGPEEGKD
jgi:hypothetical protein